MTASKYLHNMTSNLSYLMGILFLNPGQVSGQCHPNKTYVWGSITVLGVIVKAVVFESQ